ncbi:DNRLRE domain-containing protein [Actinoplanes sp. TFC3]|uniref:CBM96 family carbohydrate-binding protein n=1 Tax=Actinoplanes sp. TFC3 TaxID=1710355 RepID=UPI00083778AF|nr:DNRLRE domain-containing protein [Actinoplanes sp. TFC3]
MRRSKLKKSVTALAALAAGAGATVALGAAGSAASAAAGPELKLAAADDTYVSSGRKDASFGAEEKLSVGRLERDTKVGFLRFVVPAGTKATGARLKLATVGAVSGKFTLNRVAVTEWSEKSLTAQSAPALGAVVDSLTPKGDAADVTFDVSGAITGPGTYTFALQSSATSAVTRFRSSESSNGPELVVSTQAGTAPPVAEEQPGEGETPSDYVPEMPAEDIPPAVEDEDMPPPPPSAPAGGCVTGKLLVPSCGVLWGAAAGGFTDAPRDAALTNWEKLSGRTASIFHTYHKGDEPFPTASEMAMARDAARPRVLLLNWKIAYGSSWAKVAKGEQDARIDRFAARVKSTFPEKFFLVLNHEPENDVVARTGSGWEAKDFAAMYRHTIQRLRAQGVSNAINVLTYMGNEKWMAQSWWKDLYPGDGVVDWIGLDSYVSAERGYYHAGVFNDLLDRAAPNGQGFYDWAATKHATKPMMVAEWGVYHRVGKVADKTAGFRSVLPTLKRRPNIKAVVYFDTKHDDQGDRDISIDSTRANLAAFRALAADKMFDVKIAN